MESVNKTLNILEVFLDHQDELTLNEISRFSGINKTTAYRVASTLAKRGYLKQQTKRGKYFLGSIYSRYFQVTKSKVNLKNIITPHLIRLSQQIGEIVIIAYNNGIENLFPENFQGMARRKDILRIITDGVNGIPLHCTSSGKIFLSCMSDEMLQKYFLEKKPECFTPRTIIDLNQMREHLKIVQKEEVAFDNEEFSKGVIGFAVGLKDMNGEIIAAIGVAVPTALMSFSKMCKLVPEVKDCVKEISKEIRQF